MPGRTIVRHAPLSPVCKLGKSPAHLVTWVTGDWVNSFNPLILQLHVASQPHLEHFIARSHAYYTCIWLDLGSWRRLLGNGHLHPNFNENGKPSALLENNAMWLTRKVTMCWVNATESVVAFTQQIVTFRVSLFMSHGIVLQEGTRLTINGTNHLKVCNMHAWVPTVLSYKMELPAWNHTLDKGFQRRKAAWS